MAYKINEIFLSVQGEGPSIGALALFVRFSGCNMQCTFCDTDHESSVELNLEQVIGWVQKQLAEAKLPMQGDKLAGIKCVLTGGEPLLQADMNLVEAIKEIGLSVCLETNGTVEFEDERYLQGLLLACDEVVVSPKSMEYNQTTVQCASALKLLVPIIAVGLLPETVHEMASHLGKRRFYTAELEEKKSLIFQPITPGEGVDSWRYHDHCLDAVRLATAWTRDHGEAWRVIPQTHKSMGLK